MSRNVIFKAFAEDYMWLQLMMHIQKTSTLQNIEMINPGSPGTRLLPCFLPTLPLHNHQRTAVKNVLLTAGDYARWIAYRLFALLNKDSKIPGRDRISEIMKDFDPQCKQSEAQTYWVRTEMAIQELSMLWKHEQHTIEHREPNFVVGDTQGNHPSWAKTRVTHWGAQSSLPSIKIKTTCRHQSESSPGYKKVIFTSPETAK